MGLFIPAGDGAAIMIFCGGIGLIASVGGCGAGAILGGAGEPVEVGVLAAEAMVL